MRDFFAFFHKSEFEMPTEDDNFFTDVTTTWNDKYEKIKNWILDETIEYVSFDLFDTLVVRPFLEPGDLFVFMEEDFRKVYTGTLSFRDIRSASEKRCRQKMHITNPDFLDVTLEEIYGQMQMDYSLPEETCRDLMKLEEKLEIDFCTVRKTGKELYEMAHEAGKKIIIISDMYLPMECINTILKKNGYHLHERVFLSSSERKLKYNGDLYRVAMKACNIMPTSMLHIGDNYDVDYRQAEKTGCQSVWLPKTKDILFNNINGEYTGDSINATFSNINAVIDKSVIMKNPAVRCLYALVANEIFDNPFVSFNPASNYNRDAWFIGYYVLGMHLLGITRWLAGKLKTSGCEKIHFLARDGYLLKMMYDCVRKYEAGLPESNYVYVSRRSMIAAEFQTPLELKKIITNISSVCVRTPESIYKMYGDVLKPYDEKMRLSLFERGIIPDKNFANEQEFEYFIDVLAAIAFDEQKAADGFGLISSYVRNEIGENDATFDLGYSGKIQSDLCRAAGFAVNGFFLHTNGFELAERERHNGFKIQSYYDYAPPMSGAVNEFILSDYAPSCIGYKKDGDHVTPVFEEKKVLYQEKFLLDEIADGCKKFIEDFYKNFGGYLVLFDFQPMDTSLAYERFLINPKWFDINLLKFCYLEDEYFGGIKKKRLSDFWWEQINHRNVLIPQNTAVHKEPENAAVHNGLEQLYADGLFVKLYKKLNEKYPIGSKKRERIKKVAKAFIR